MLWHLWQKKYREKYRNIYREAGSLLEVTLMWLGGWVRSQLGEGIGWGGEIPEEETRGEGWDTGVWLIEGLEWSPEWLEWGESWRGVAQKCVGGFFWREHLPGDGTSFTAGVWETIVFSRSAETFDLESYLSKCYILWEAIGLVRLWGDHRIKISGITCIDSAL